MDQNSIEGKRTEVPPWAAIRRYKVAHMTRHEIEKRFRQVDLTRYPPLGGMAAFLARAFSVTVFAIDLWTSAGLRSIL